MEREEEILESKFRRIDAGQDEILEIMEEKLVCKSPGEKGQFSYVRKAAKKNLESPRRF